MTNGKRMVKFDAPTSRMMPVSRRRLKAVCRIVVEISMTAARTMSEERAMADQETVFMKVKNFSSSFFWSCTSATPGMPLMELATMSNFPGLDRFTR